MPLTVRDVTNWNKESVRKINRNVEQVHRHMLSYIDCERIVFGWRADHFWLFIFFVMIVVVVAVVSPFKMLNNVLIKLLKEKYYEEYECSTVKCVLFVFHWSWVRFLKLGQQKCWDHKCAISCVFFSVWAFSEVSAVRSLRFSSAENYVQIL